MLGAAKRERLRRATTGKRVVVTGASSGLGAQCAVSFAAHGAIVALLARRKSRLHQVARQVRKLGGKSVVIPVDIGSPAGVKQASRRILTELGGCDVLINNAGAYLEGPYLTETEVSDWEELMNTNVRGPFLVCRALVPHMIEAGWGRIVNIISASNDLEGAGAFRISKIALEVFNAVMAAELVGTGVTATAFNPGFMKTETSSFGRSPRAVATAILDLVHRSSEYLNGSTIDIKWRGRDYRLWRRREGRGPFGC